MGTVSPFVHRYDVDGTVLFFHSLTLDLAASTVSFPKKEEEEGILRSYRASVAEDRGIVMGTFFITTRCVRKCEYCFIRDLPGEDLSMGEIDRALDLMGNGPADLLLYGGEPLLRQDLVRYTAERLKGSSARINLILATGGVPVDTALAHLLASIDAFMIVSIDGPPGVQRFQRPMVGGGDSFALAEEAFHSFRDAGCRVGISMTMTRRSAGETLDSFIWLMERFQPDDMGLNPWLHPVSRGPNPCQAGLEESFQAVTQCMEAAIEGGMYIEQLARRVRPFSSRSPRLKDCASSGGRLVVAPGGLAGTCDCMTCRGINSVPLDDREGIKGLMNGFRELSPVNFEGCLRCPALAICGGGCRYDASMLSGSLSGVWETRCAFERRFLAWMIERAARHGRDSLIPRGGFRERAVPMPVGTMLGESR